MGGEREKSEDGNRINELYQGEQWELGVIATGVQWMEEGQEGEGMGVVQYTHNHKDFNKSKNVENIQI